MWFERLCLVGFWFFVCFGCRRGWLKMFLVFVLEIWVGFLRVVWVVGRVFSVWRCFCVCFGVD